MHEDIKKYADEGNIKELKYKFSSSLDVDPTFEKYKEDFDYCCRCQKKVFEEYKELTPIENKDQSKWNKNYWANLKQELIDNFSKERLEHMIKVAKVIYKDKIERLIEERQQPKEEETKYTKITSKLTEKEKAIEKQKNEKKITEQRRAEQNELTKTNKAIKNIIVQEQKKLEKDKKEAEITSTNIKRENEKSFIKDGLMIVGSSLLVGVAGKLILDNINSRGKKSVKDRVQAILHSKISPNEKIAKLENIKAELSNRLNSSNNKRKIEEHIEKIDNHIKSLQQAETFIDEKTIEEQ